MAKSHFHRVVLPLLLLAGALQLAVNYVSYRNARTASDTTDEVVRRRMVLRALSQLHGSVVEAESARRGTLLTGDPEYLQHYANDIAEAERAMLELGVHLRTERRAQLEELQRLLAAKLDHMAQLDLAAGREPASLRAGREHMDRLRDQIQRIDSEQRRLVEALTVRAADSNHKAIQTILWGSGSSFLLVVMALVLVERENRKRIQAENSLRRSEEEYRNLVVHIPDVPWKTDAAGAPTYLGEGIRKLTGYTAEELISGGGAFWRTRIHEGDLPAMNQGFAGLFEHGVPLEVEYRFQRKHGAWAWLYCRASIVSEEDGNRYTRGLVSDITARKTAEENNARLAQALADSNRELEARNREVERANLLKSRFLANMSHELRTPLNAIMGFSELLIDPANGPMSDKQRRWLGHIRAGSTHLLQLINDILDLSKVEADQLEFRPEPVRLAEAIPEVLSIIRPLAQSRQVNLAEYVPDDLVVEVDRTRLKQIIYNLLSNAVKFTPAHGLVRLEAQGYSEYVCISVRDTGMGIRPEDQQVIFEEFRQVSETAKGVPEGTGLGLAITRRLVERQGGKIWLESEIGKGSRFSFTVRRSEKAPDPTADPAQTARENSQFRILVIDDEPVTRELVASHLEAEGFATVTASTASEGLAAARSQRPDAIILAVMLPDAEGWDVIHELKRDPATEDIPVIMVSVIDRQEKGFTFGAADYLVKPISRNSLLQVLQKHLPTTPNAEVLIVEDQAPDREIITSVLAGAGVRSVAVEDGRQALEALLNDDGRFHLVILDLMLPGMDGFELLRRIKDNRVLRSVPVIVVTGKELSLAESDFLRAESQALFMKGEAWRSEFIRQVHKTLARRPQTIPG